MSKTLWIFIITGAILYSIYYDINLTKYFKNYQKMYKMALVVVFAFGMLKLINHSPKMSYENMQTLNSFVKVMPIDKNSKDMITPFLSSGYDNINNPIQSIQKLKSSGKGTKRSVSETKKKYVASLQEWKCKKCGNQLSAWFEVDHVKRLEHGGTNEVSNLEALCRECHGEKTSMENL